METNLQPFVSVVTPVYNGETFLAECIESVLAQTYTNWEYVIVNNCSTDRTLAIAQRYSEKDSRIRIHNNTAFLPMIQNFNNAMRQISPKSKYCKVVHADDLLLSDCIMQMVRLAETYRSVGVVGSYRINGDCVVGGVSYPVTVIPGREIGRSILLGGPDVLGPPTAVLIRSEIVRSRDLFYNEVNVATADKEVIFDILQNWDFGFVHQVLTFFRQHKMQASTFFSVSGAWTLGTIIILEKYGLIYLSREECQKVLKGLWKRYYDVLANAFFEHRGKKFWDFNQDMLKKLGYSLNTPRLVKVIALRLCDALLNPKSSFERILRRIQKVGTSSM